MSAYSQFKEQNDYLDDDDLAEICDVKVSTIKDWRSRGKSPTYHLVGSRFLYQVDAVNAWIKANAKGGIAQEQDPLI